MYFTSRRVKHSCALDMSWTTNEQNETKRRWDLCARFFGKRKETLSPRKFVDIRNEISHPQIAWKARVHFQPSILLQLLVPCSDETTDF